MASRSNADLVVMEQIDLQLMLGLQEENTCIWKRKEVVKGES